jgi:hypothetical protein
MRRKVYNRKIKVLDKPGFRVSATPKNANTKIENSNNWYKTYETIFINFVNL